MGALALGMSEVSAADISRMGPAVYQKIGMGKNLLRPATQTEQVAPCSGASPFIPMATHPIPLLAGLRSIQLGPECLDSTKTCGCQACGIRFKNVAGFTKLNGFSC
jgi:hypothetical protein